MEALDLQRFCSRDESRFSICQPWVADGYRYATDGRIIVRVKVPSEPDWHLEGFRPPTKGALEIFAEAKPAELVPVPVPPVSGDLENSFRDCSDCQGKGGFHDDGSRFYLVCEDCDGFGVLAHWGHIHVTDIPVSEGAIRLIQTLPEAVLYEPTEEARKRLQLYFTFTGGEGVFLGLKPIGQEGDKFCDDLPWPGPEHFGHPLRFPTPKERGAL